MNRKQVSLSVDTLDLLKEKILKSAIEGKLVPQLDKEPEMKQIGDAPEEAPFEIPPKWKWVKLSAIASSNIGLTYKPTDLIDDLGGTPVLRANNIQNGKLNLEGMKRVKGANQLPKNFVHPGDLLMCARNGSKRLVGKCCLIPELKERMMFGAFMAVIRSDFSSYLHIFFSSDAFKEYLGSVNTTTINQITQKNLLNTWVPLPPFEEQKRIVEKVDCLFSKIDGIQKSMDEVYQVGNSLEKQLLRSAIKGQLAPQLDEEPEVEQIGIAPDDVPFEIPKKWKWGRLSDYGSIVGGGTPSTSVGEYWDGEIPWVTPADLGKIQSTWIDRGAKFITKLGLEKSSAKKMPAGSIVYSSRAPIGRVAIAKNELCTSQGCKSFVPDPTLVDSKYAYFALTALTPEIIARASGTTFKEISGKQFGKTLIPIPPLREQLRIVEKLDKLMLEIQKLK